MAVLLVISILLIIQLIYFLITSICYIHHNPQYRVFWAACCVKKPTNIKVYPTISEANVNTTFATSGSSHTVLTTATPSTTDNTSDNKDVPKDHVFDAQKINTKKKAFINFGLDTISQCILAHLYLICLIFLICIRFIIGYITESNTWRQHVHFCRYGLKLLGIRSIPHYALQISLCLPSLKIQYMYKTNKFDRMLPIISIVYMIICVPLEMLHKTLDTTHVAEHEGQILCVPSSSLINVPSNLFFNSLSVLIMFQYYSCFVLCFITMIVPIYMQRKMLLNLPKNKANEALHVLIIKVNELSKRMCIAVVIIIIVFVTQNILYWLFAFNHKIKPFLSVVMWLCYVEGYLLMVFIHKDWKTRLCSLCSYGYIRVCDGCVPKNIHNANQMSIELVACSQKRDSSECVLPKLVPDVSTLNINTQTFTDI